ncbi:hypothetical protein Maes01_02306 [Microbulbifer aestuariivivens]|uniref:Ankyrin repeat domain-containing protein n=1 Tax=Microbulbifer aestuariivivens TaxID=1908308 RepID=A0ABP9WRJ4_9GAMM
MNEKYTPKDVYEAVRAGNLELAKTIFDSDSSLINLVTPLGSWLHVATQYGHKALVEFLIEKGLDINVKGGPSGVTPLNTAAHEGNLELLEFFLERNAEIDISEPDRNPLFAAIHAGHIDIAEKLLDFGIDVEVKYTGQTMKDMDALAYCHEWGRTDIAKLIESYK